MRRTIHLPNGFCTMVILVLALALAWTSGEAQAYTVKQTETGAVVRWHESAIVFGVSRASGRGIGGGRLNQAMDMAAETWAPTPGVPLVSLEHGVEGQIGYNARANRNLVLVPEAWTFKPGLLAVTVSTFDTRTGRLIDADIAVNPDQSFAMFERETGTGSDYDLPSVVTHELGHALGLGETDDDPNATMWPSLAAGSTEQRSLAADDEAGIEAIYLAASVAGSAAGAAGAGVDAAAGVEAAGCSTGGSAVPSALAWALFAAVIVACAWRSRRRGYLGFVAVAAVASGCYAHPEASREPADVAVVTEGVHGATEASESDATENAGSELTVQGHVERLGTFDVEGVIWTNFVIETEEGTVEFLAPGGHEGEIEQIVSGFEHPRTLGRTTVRLWHDGWNYQLAPQHHVR